MPHHLPHLHYPEKEPLVKKLFRQLDVNGYEEDRRKRFKERQKQINLAKKNGYKHIGR